MTYINSISCEIPKMEEQKPPSRIRKTGVLQTSTLSHATKERVHDFGSFEGFLQIVQIFTQLS